MNIFEALELIKKYTKCFDNLYKQINVVLNVIKYNEIVSERKLIVIGYAVLINTLNSNKDIIKKNNSIKEYNEYLLAIEVIQDYLDGIKIINKLVK